jgi:hypothetical protein
VQILNFCEVLDRSHLHLNRPSDQLSWRTPCHNVVHETWSPRGLSAAPVQVCSPLPGEPQSQKESPAEPADREHSTKYDALANAFQQFSLRSILALAPCQPLLSQCAPCPCLPRHAKPVFSEGCRLLKSLASLFRTASLCFQELAASFRKTPGVAWEPSAHSHLPRRHSAKSFGCHTYKFAPRKSFPCHTYKKRGVVWVLWLTNHPAPTKLLAER